MGSQGDVTHALRTTDKKLESKRKTIITPPLHKEKAWDYEFIIQNICNTLDSHMKMSLGLISRPIFFYFFYFMYKNSCRKPYHY